MLCVTHGMCHTCFGLTLQSLGIRLINSFANPAVSNNHTLLRKKELIKHAQGGGKKKIRELV